MHLVKDHIREMAEKGAKLTNEAQLHLNQCGECGNLFRLFVLRRYYTERTHEDTILKYLPVQQATRLS